MTVLHFLIHIPPFSGEKANKQILQLTCIVILFDATAGWGGG